MKRFIDYLDRLQTSKNLTRTQIYAASFGILLFLSLALIIPNYILRNQQTTDSRAQVVPLPSPPPPPFGTPPPSPVTIGILPSSSNEFVGSPFSVDVVVDGAGQEFNAAEATVGVSSNLTINSISIPSTIPCNFVYTQTPTVSDPSFAGAILGGSSTICKVYTLQIIPNSAGTGIITFTNASVKAYSDNSDILSSVIDGSYTLTVSSPTNTPVPPTATPVPPTNTPVPPTATPVPPTNTPVPPTATPVPPTNTPILLAAPIINTVTAPTYQSSILLEGSRNASLISIFANDSTDGMIYPTATTWQVWVSLTLGLNNFTVYGLDFLSNQSTTSSVNINRHRLSDINGDAFIDLVDISLFSTDWKKTSNFNHILSDMNSDSSVDLTDFSILAKQYVI
jgi:hypothetical protein